MAEAASRILFKSFHDRCLLQEVDLLLYQWDEAAKALEVAEAAFEASELTTRPTALIGGCCCCGRTKASRPVPPAAWIHLFIPNRLARPLLSRGSQRTLSTR